ncbi:MAG: hypothetical protein QE263_01335 [Vampirovibrionales bacterium]|nr:hypothetical protein [Vampirovibrionales bacterium]
MTVTTFGTSSPNPFVINTFSAGSVVPNTGLNTISTNTTNTNGTSGTPQTGLPSTVYPIGVPLANGIIVEYPFGTPGKELIQCRNAAGVSFTVNGAQFADTAALESIPAGIISQIKPDTLIGKFEYSTPQPGVPLGYNGFTDKLPSGFPIPLVNGQPVKMVLFNPNDSKWFGYAPNNSFVPNNLWDAQYNGDTYGALSSPPSGLNVGYINFGNIPFSVAPTSFSQMFSDYIAAQAFQAANPGSTLTDIPYTKQITYPGGPQFGATLQNLLNAGWKTTGDPIVKTSIADQQFNIQEGSTQYNNLINQGYTAVANGKSIQVQLTPPIAGQSFNDQTDAQIKALQAQYPNLIVTPDGFFTTNTTIPGGDIYNNGTSVAVGSATYNNLIAQGWTAKPTKSIFTPNPDKITTQTGITKAALDALDPNVWKVIKSYPGSPYHMAETVTLNNVSPVDLEALKKQYPDLEIKKINYKTLPGSSSTKVESVVNQDFGMWMEAMNKDDGAETFSASEATQLMEDDKYRTASPFGLPNNELTDSVKAGAGEKDCDKQAYFGDPFFSAFEDDKFDVPVDPDAALYKVAAGGNNDFKYQWVKEIAPINDNGNKAATGYYLTAAVDGEVHKFSVKDGIIEHIKPDGTKSTISPDETFTLKDSDGRTWVTIDKATAAKAGENGVDEIRSRVTLNSPPSQGVVTDLLAKGISKNEIYDKASRKQTMWFGTRLAGGDGTGVYGDDDSDAYVGVNAGHQATATAASATGVKLYYDAQLDSCYDPGVFTCTTLGEPTQEIESYDICYIKQKDCNDTLYDVQKTEKVPDTETKQVTFCKDKVVTTTMPKSDAKVPDVPATYKEVKCFDLTKTKEEKGYNLIKEEVCHNYQVSGGTPGINGNCVVNDYWASPLALDLDGNGNVDTSATNWKFDLDGTGVKTWKGSLDKGDGFLVFDKDGDNTLDDGSELFGNITAAGDGDHKDGLEALRAYAEQYLPGSSADGLNEAEIAILENEHYFRVQITDSDGNPQLVKPSSLGITKFNLNPDPSLESFTDDNGVYHNPRTFFTMNGVENTNLDDLWFQQVVTDDAVSNTTTNTATSSSDEFDEDDEVVLDDDITAEEKPPRRKPQPWERNNYQNPWLYNNQYNQGGYNMPTPDFNQNFNQSWGAPYGGDPMMQMMSMMSSMAGASPYGVYQQQQMQQQAQAQQMQQMMMNFYLQALIASLMPQLSGQQYQSPVPQQQQYKNPFSFY